MKSIFRWLLLVAVTVAVSGCGPDNSVQKPDNPAPPPKAGPKSYRADGMQPGKTK